MVECEGFAFYVAIVYEILPEFTPFVSRVVTQYLFETSFTSGAGRKGWSRINQKWMVIFLIDLEMNNLKRIYLRRCH